MICLDNENLASDQPYCLFFCLKCKSVFFAQHCDSGPRVHYARGIFVIIHLYITLVDHVTCIRSIKKCQGKVVETFAYTSILMSQRTKSVFFPKLERMVHHVLVESFMKSTELLYIHMVDQRISDLQISKTAWSCAGPYGPHWSNRWSSILLSDPYWWPLDENYQSGPLSSFPTLFSKQRPVATFL